MTTENMTIHRALIELKLIDKRINDEIYSVQFCAAAKANESKISGIGVADFKRNGVAAFDKIQNLIARRNAIKAAVAKSNAETRVTVCGSEMTVAEAIYMNQEGVNAKRELLNKMKSDYSSAIRTIENQNAKLDSDADIYVTTLCGSKEGKSGLAPDAIDTIRDAYINGRKYELFDTVGVKDAIDNLTQEVDAFTAEVDSALSCSNAQTVIQINY